ncbi:substrate-binding domain-containing protein [Actinomadura madurae]|uniref:substrate-binding domain-containing protein n=1 Tax=Actinomadura madurae TaxID=1993 RepID=UPI000D940779|nr:substrate-binding domain-containing protein [Actinomadura madurae]SPT51243.1 D-xylose-binding periplasmic protein precursor [Actinomadura madurae]
MGIHRHRPGRGAIALAVVFCAALAATGCSRSGESASGEQKVIGVSLYSQVQSRWQFDAKAMQQEAAKNGDKVIMTFANSDPQKQTQDVQSLLSQGIDVLVIASTDVKIGGSLIGQAKRQGVKTIAYDIGVQGGTPDWFIQRKQSEVARMQVAAAKKFAPKGNYVVMKGDAGNDLAQASSVVYAQLAKDPNIRVVYNDWTPNFSADKALQIAAAQLSQHKDDIQAIIANTDTVAEPAGQVLKDRGLAGKVFLSGLDAEPAALKLVAQGVMTMTIWTPVDQLGREAAKAAHQLANGQTPSADEMSANDVSKSIPTKHVEMTEVNKSNLCEFITKIAPAGWATVEQVFGNPGACR